jgi:hypothetical protein
MGTNQQGGRDKPAHDTPRHGICRRNEEQARKVAGPLPASEERQQKLVTSAVSGDMVG